MCVALPGQVIKIKDHTADVDFNGNIVKAETGLVHCKEGDPVLVHAGCILQVLSETDAEAMQELFREIGAL